MIMQTLFSISISITLSGFKPGSTLSDQSWDQSTLQRPPCRSIMSSNRQVHPQKIYQTWLTCSYSHYSIYGLSHHYDIHSSTLVPICWSLCRRTLTTHIIPSVPRGNLDKGLPGTTLRNTMQAIHNHIDPTTDLGSCLCTWWPTSVLSCISLKVLCPITFVKTNAKDFSASPKTQGIWASFPTLMVFG